MNGFATDDMVSVNDWHTLRRNANSRSGYAIMDSDLWKTNKQYMRFQLERRFGKGLVSMARQAVFIDVPKWKRGPRKRSEMDIDSFIKFLVDSCQRIFYKNDRQVDALQVRKVEGIEKASVFIKDLPVGIHTRMWDAFEHA